MLNLITQCLWPVKFLYLEQSSKVSGNLFQISTVVIYFVFIKTYHVFQGPLTIETKTKFHIMEMVDGPPRPFLCPFPHKGSVYDYRFVKTV